MPFLQRNRSLPRASLKTVMVVKRYQGGQGMSRIFPSHSFQVLMHFCHIDLIGFNLIAYVTKKASGVKMWRDYNLGCGIPGIPTAPTGKRHFLAVDKDLMARQIRLQDRLPVLTKEEIAKLRHPFHTILLHELMTTGYFDVVQEVNHILRKEEMERKGGRYRLRMGGDLIGQENKFILICHELKRVQDLKGSGRYEAAVIARKELAESLMKDDQDIWLSQYILQTTLKNCRKMEFNKSRTQAEVHCLLAFLARETNDNLESALSAAIEHLTVCRSLSKDQPWQFKQNVMIIRLKKPIALHGLRHEGESYEVVDGRSMTLYMIATLLEHEMLISLANQIMHCHHKYPTVEDVSAAHVYADSALKLALEVRHPVALSSALVRFGLVLRHSGAYENAMTYFRQLQHHCEITGDFTTEAIAYHNIGMCMIGMHNTIEALQYFVRQREIAYNHGIKDLEADSMSEIGHVLLQEGHLWEAEECYAVAGDIFTSLAHTDTHADAAWAMCGIATGHKLWGRYAGHVRNGKSVSVGSIIDWKIRRKAMETVERPEYETDYIVDVYKPVDTGAVQGADSSTESSKNSGETLPSKVTVTFSLDIEEAMMNTLQISDQYDISNEEKEFLSDMHDTTIKHKELDYRRKSISQTKSMNVSLATARGDANNRSRAFSTFNITGLPKSVNKLSVADLMGDRKVNSSL